MENHFNLLNITRRNIIKTIEALSLAQINTIPNNFNNSIGWQVAHILVTQQLLHYKLSGNSVLINENLVESYRKGCSGKQQLTQKEWEGLLILFLKLPQQLEKDYNSEIFNEYSSYSTSYNATLNNIEEAIVFNNIHEAMHFGTINAMIKSLKVS